MLRRANIIPQSAAEYKWWGERYDKRREFDKAARSGGLVALLGGAWDPWWIRGGLIEELHMGSELLDCHDVERQEAANPRICALTM